MCAYDRRFAGFLKSLRCGGDTPRSWARLVWLDFLGLCAVGALLAALFTLVQA